MKILVGLGNPGEHYRRTRHNAGFWVVEALAKSLGMSFRTSNRDAHTVRAVIRSGSLEQDVLLAKPQTFMNHSGAAALALMENTGCGPSDLVVIHDELDLPLGRLQFKARGGHGGHRGLESIAAVLQTQEFYRLRVGIGRPPPPLEARAYVLSDFLPEEKPIVSEVVDRAVLALECFVTEGPETAMNRFHQILST
ncbi:MAG TPA: aminoacyl-tRNA hydrolase [Nitrospiria bacterium]